MERLEYILQNQLKSIATLFENVPLNMNIKTETKKPDWTETLAWIVKPTDE